MVAASATLFLPAPPASAQVCQGGTAGGFACDRVDLLAQVPLSALGGGAGSDSWGWTDPLTGVEYALMGRSNGTAFVELADPSNPRVLGNLPTQDAVSAWRDIKVFADHAFIVADRQTDHGMQVFDLRRLRSVTNPPVTFQPTTVYTQFNSAHNIAINEETGFAYVVGGETCSGGLHMIDVRNPATPTFAGCFSQDGDTHDVQCVVYRGPDVAHRGRELCFASNEDTLTVVDVTDKANPRLLSRTGYTGSAFTHQGWLTEDHAFFFLGDELDERNFGHNTRTYIWDVTDVDAPFVTSVFTSHLPVVDHNLYVHNGFTFEANYTGGLRILRNDDPATGDVSEVAFFDTFPQANNTQFNGAWNVYPFFQSGVVIISDINRGLFVLRPDLGTTPPPPPPPPPPVGSCLFSESFGSGAGGFAFVDDPEDPAYTAGAASGGAVSVAVGGVDDADISSMLGSWQLSCDLSVATEVAITLMASLTQSSEYEANETSELRLGVNGATEVLASLSGNGNGGAPQTTGPQTFTARASLPAGRSTLSLGCFNNLKTLADERTDCVFDSIVVEEDAGEPPPPGDCLHVAEFESGADGWLQGADTCTTGSFVVGSPTEVVNGGVTTQVAGGAGGSANALFTAPNSAAGTDDVDGGTCEALSPAIDASGESAVEISLSFFHGQRDGGDDAADGFTIEVLNNGTVAATLVSRGDVVSNAAWTAASTTVSNPGTIQLRVRASDGTAGGDLVEGGVDGVRVCRADAPPPPPPGGCTVNDDFESGAAGWANDPASTCTTGAYVLGTPTAQANGGITTQVGGANSGVNALFTANNTAAGTDDVDGGSCILRSPTFSVAAASTLSVAYFHGQRDAGGDAADFFSLEVSTDGGASFRPIASNGDAISNAAWTRAMTSIPAGSNVVLKVQCSDGTASGDLVECGIDDVSICDN